MINWVELRKPFSAGKHRVLVSKTMTVFSLVWPIGVFPKWKRNSVNSGIGGSRGGREGRTPPPGRPNSFDFMQFSGKFGVFTPPLEGSRPPLGKILDPPLSGNQINHWNMNWAQFKDPVAHMCLAGAVVASWTLTPRGGWVAGSIPFTVVTIVTEFGEFIENIQGNSTVPVTHTCN